MTGGEELKPGTPREVYPNLIGVTSSSATTDGNLRLLSIATTQRPRDIRLIVDWTALLGR